jgi:hypothetical protein
LFFLLAEHSSSEREDSETVRERAQRQRDWERSSEREMRGIERERDREKGRDTERERVAGKRGHGGPRTQGTPAVLFPTGQVLFRPNPATCEPRKPERPENPWLTTRDPLNPTAWSLVFSGDFRWFQWRFPVGWSRGKVRWPENAISGETELRFLWVVVGGDFR